nr:unnamed protein product [Digitaria exilis]
MAGQSEAMIEKMQLRQSYRNIWHTDLTNAVRSMRVLHAAQTRALQRHVKCGESQCPEVCLATEVFCCFGNSVASTRFLLQDEFNIQTTQCDNCIIAFMFFLQQLACICSLIACIVGNSELSEIAHVISCMSNLVYWTVCSCMQTQHKVEMDKRDGTLNTMSVPPMQQMSRW